MKRFLSQTLFAACALLCSSWAAASDGMFSCEGSVSRSDNIDMSRKPWIMMDLFLNSQQKGTLITDSDFPGQIVQVDLQMNSSGLLARQDRAGTLEDYTVRLGDLSISRRSGRFTMVVTLVKKNSTEPAALVSWGGKCVQAGSPTRVPG